MRIIDEKGKLFGKLNIIDMFLLLLILAVTIGGVIKFSNLDLSKGQEDNNVVLVIEAEKQKQGFVDAISKGDILYDSVRGTEFGTVINKNVKPHKELVIGKDGKVHFMEIPGSFDVEIELSSLGNTTDDGIVIANNQIYIGSFIRLKSNLYVFNSTVIDIRY